MKDYRRNIYLKDTLVRTLLVLSALVSVGTLSAQTCCSGGVPLSGNIGFEGSARGVLQLELSYDLNLLATLKQGSEILEDPGRTRRTHSLILKSGYSITSWLAVDALFSYVIQERNITYLDRTDFTRTSGLGDAVILPKLILSRMSASGTELQVGVGPKIPLGRSDLASGQGITLNADLQPGSGSWDMISWLYAARSLTFRPSLVASGQVVARLNGVNRDYLGGQEYQFGNAFQVVAGLGDQLLLGNRIVSPSVSIRYRHALRDRFNDFAMDNTGGQWIFLIPAVTFHPSPRILINVIPEIPVYSRVDGVQLSPSFRIQTGVYIRFGDKNIQQEIEWQL
jgi:hypothetical protein